MSLYFPHWDGAASTHWFWCFGSVSSKSTRQKLFCSFASLTRIPSHTRNISYSLCKFRERTMKYMVFYIIKDEIKKFSAPWKNFCASWQLPSRRYKMSKGIYNWHYLNTYIGNRDVFRILQDAMFYENSWQIKAVNYFRKTSILGVWKGSENAYWQTNLSLGSKSIPDFSKSTSRWFQNCLLNAEFMVHIRKA